MTITSEQPEPIQAPPGHLNKYPGYWHGPATPQNQFTFLRIRATELESEVARLTAENARLQSEFESLKALYAPFAKFNTPEWKDYIKRTENLYRTRTKGKVTP